MYRNSLFAKYGGWETFLSGWKMFLSVGRSSSICGLWKEGERTRRVFSVYNEERERQKKVLLVAFGRDCMACLGTKKRFSSLEVMFGKAEADGKKSYYSFFLPHTTQQVGVAKADRGADCHRSFFLPPWVARVWNSPILALPTPWIPLISG